LGIPSSHGILRGFVREPILNDFQQPKMLWPMLQGEFATSCYKKGAGLPSTLTDDVVARRGMSRPLGIEYAGAFHLHPRARCGRGGHQIRLYLNPALLNRGFPLSGCLPQKPWAAGSDIATCEGSIRGKGTRRFDGPMHMETLICRRFFKSLPFFYCFPLWPPLPALVKWTRPRTMVSRSAGSL
jgi:hypothetical protein